MGVKIADIVPSREVTFEELSGKVLAVDSYNILYQFLASIRQRDGTPLQDSQGRVTSHLSGLFSRTANLMQKGLKPAFVFDGKPPALKAAEVDRRKRLKEEAKELLEVAREAGDEKAMRKYSMRTSRLTTDMVDESKSLIEALGLPVVQAPSEGEAQAAFMVARGDAYAVASEDYDSLLFGAKRLLRHLTVTGRRRVAGTLTTRPIQPTMIELEDVMKTLEFDQDRLIALAMLVGTDFNPGGVKGIGPKKALKLLKDEADLGNVFQGVGWVEHCEHPWETIFKVFKEMPTTEDYALDFGRPDPEAVLKLLVDEHDFSERSVERTLEKIGGGPGPQQKGLQEFF